MLNLFRKIKSAFLRTAEIQYPLNSSNRVHPRTEALRIATVYGAFGVLWIILSDNLSKKYITSQNTLNSFQTYKGWFYVLITVIIVYILIRDRLILFHKATQKLYENYEELLALEDELKQEKDLSESFFNHAPIMTLIMDPNFLITRFSPFAEMSTGYTKLEVLGKNALDIFLPPEEKEATIDMFKNSKTDNSPNIIDNEVVCKDGSRINVLWHINCFYNKNNKMMGIVCVGTNITELIATEKKLHSLAYFDALTDLPNRSMFEIKTKKILNDKSISTFALVYMDIDNFKHINDTLGHHFGDLLLKYTANILKHHIKEPNFAARLSGDEFVIVLENIKNKNDIPSIINSLLARLRRPWIVENQEFFISFSMGISIYPEQGNDLETLLKKADTAMFYVKKDTKDNYCFYTDEMHEKNLTYINMTNQLRHAVDNEEFKLFYQPIIDLNSGKVIGTEALIRWIHPEKGFISPLEFIPLAEEIGYIHKIDSWVFKTACNQKKLWESLGYNNLQMSINLSGKRLSQFELVEELTSVLKALNMPFNNIQIEITETAVMEDLKASTKILKQLQDLGFTIALDDFGTGYSSLTYLKNLPIDTVKMDRQFIKDIAKEDEEDVILQSIIQLVHALNLKVVAEGVETYEQLEFLKINGCDNGQGYLFGKPMPPGDIEVFLKY